MPPRRRPLPLLVPTALAALLLLLLLPVHRAPAQPAAGVPAAAEPTLGELRDLADLLRRPTIQSWLARQAASAPAPVPAAAAAAAEAGGPSMQESVAGRLDATRAFLRQLAGAAPTLPGELGRARASLAAEMQERGPLAVLVLLAVFAGLGSGLEWLFWWATTGFRRRMIANDLDTARARLRAVWLRFAYGLGVLLAFALGSVGAFLLFDWPPLLRRVILAYLVVFLIARLVLVLGRILLAPAAPRFRVVPMADATARFWFVWSAVLVGFFFFVRATIDLLLALGVAGPAAYLFGISCGVALLGLTLFAVWRHPGRETGRPPPSGEHRLGRVLASLYLVAAWLLLFTGSPTPFYVAILLLLLPLAIRGADLAVAHVLRPPGSEAAGAAAPTVAAASLGRGLRAALLIGGAYLVAWTAGLDVGAMAASDTAATRLLRGAINAAVVILLADFAWHLARAWIDRELAEAAAAPAGPPADGDEARRARLRTLLPIFRNVLFVVVLVTAALMALSGLGVEIGPLVAGAGVVGVSVGFGAQTLVKDVISGLFFLLDDAFRVGEYIESGSIRGTVEAFSLRSIKLRHHRGYLHTVPFGSLEKITNYSRDWVIDKVTISVTYATDLDKVKRIVKQVGKELQADPELAPNILETLKMQGVEQFGDFAVQVRMKMMTRPGEQFVIRRRAYALIKKAFAENGIEFAFPTVTVAGGDAATAAAAAQKGLEATRPPATAA